MLFERKAGRVVTVRSDAEPENFCKPAVDPMMRSLVSVYGAKVLAVILTGMGQDGAKGCEAVVEADGTVFSQDESTSVVWGMPAAVAPTHSPTAPTAPNPAHTTHPGPHP